MPSAYSYIFYMLVFTLFALAIVWAKGYPCLKKHAKTIATVIVIGIVFQLIADPFAEAWQAWSFSPDKILGLWIFNFPIEDTIFFALVSAAISSAALVFVDRERRKGR